MMTSEMFVTETEKGLITNEAGNSNSRRFYYCQAYLVSSHL